MAQKKVWIGSRGPFLFDDTEAYDDGVKHRGLRTETVIDAANFVVNNLTSNKRLAFSDVNKEFQEVNNLTNWIAGGSNVTVTDDGDGTVTISSASAPVQSVFGRTGDVIAQSGDYSFGQIGGTLGLGQIEQGGATDGQFLVWDGVNSVWTPQSHSAPVDSVFGRTGAVTAQAGDYDFSQISGASTYNVSNFNNDNAYVPKSGGTFTDNIIIKGGTENTTPIKVYLRGPSQDSTVSSDQVMADLWFGSIEGGGSEVAGIRTWATRDFDLDAYGSEMAFYTTPQGGASAQRRMTIVNGGAVGIATIPSDETSYRLVMGGAIDMQGYNVNIAGQVHLKDQGRGDLRLVTDNGSLPGYSTDNYPTVKSSYQTIYLAPNNQYAGVIGVGATNPNDANKAQLRLGSAYGPLLIDDNLEAKGIASGQVTIGDDNAKKIGDLGSAGRGTVQIAYGAQGAHASAVNSPNADIIAQSSNNFEVGTGTPTGTSGNDFALTLFVNSSGELYLENRTGSTKTIPYMIMTN